MRQLLAAMVMTLSLLGLLTAPPVGGQLPEAEDPDDVILGEVRYAPTHAALKNEFTSTGGLTLLVPSDPEIAPAGQVHLSGVSVDLWGTQNVLELDMDGIAEPAVAYTTSSIAVDGKVAGFPNSEGAILLGEHGVYGDITFVLDGGLRRKVIMFEAWETDPTSPQSPLEQVVRIKLETTPDSPLLVSETVWDCAPQEPSVGENVTDPPRYDEGDCSSARSNGMGAMSAGTMCTPTDSRVFMIAEGSFKDKHRNFDDRMDSAFQKFKPIFQDLCVRMFLMRGYIDGSFSGWKCSSYSSGPYLTTQFSNWLDNKNVDDQYPNVDAWQLWTGRELKGVGNGPNEYYCYGSGIPDSAMRPSYTTTTRKNNGYQAVSVLEGVDLNNLDRYDPDETHERGIVSGHELAHVYGEENHPSHCKKSDQCNIMKRKVDVDDQRFYLADSSQKEIQDWWFRGVA